MFMFYIEALPEMMVKMMTNTDAIVTINGLDYFVPYDYLQYIIYDDSLHTLRLSKSGNITLYHELQKYNTSHSGYPRINLYFGQYARITTSANYNTTSELFVDSYQVKTDIPLYEKNYTSFILLAVICVGVLWRLLNK